MEPNPTPCPFCDIAGGRAPKPKRFRQEGDGRTASLIFEPLDPVAPGHTLIVPVKHVADAAESPVVTAAVMARASLYVHELGGIPCNIITSVGAEATQTVFHLHVHVVPRSKNDGLALPWTGQQTAGGARP